MPEMLVQNLWKNHYKMLMQRQNKPLQNLDRKYTQKAYKHKSRG